MRSISSYFEKEALLIEQLFSEGEEELQTDSAIAIAENPSRDVAENIPLEN
jgi:hypothetical protein